MVKTCGYCRFLLGAVFLMNVLQPAVVRADSDAPVRFVSPATSSHLEQSLDALGVLCRVLYVAAHPDDENTRLIAALSQGRHFETAYVSLTRGGGGQNLIGPELGDALGVIRTQELLAARAIDGGRQFFTRAKDFGYSKSARETLDFWDGEAVLSDLVWVIRRFRPDVVITRFSPEEGPTHGHHTASAQLAVEAFEAAADPERFVEQLQYVKPWQARRLVWNTSRWFFRGSAVDATDWHREPAGNYIARFGASPGQIAARSRSMHKSQGFGAQEAPGDQSEYFQHLAGERSPEPGIFDDIVTDWSRVAGAERIPGLLSQAGALFCGARPWEMVPALLAVRQELTRLEEKAEWAADKRRAVDQLIAQSLGLDIHALGERPLGVPGTRQKLSVEAINRSPLKVEWVSTEFPLSDEGSRHEQPLSGNQLVVNDLEVTLPPHTPVSQPYWLREPAGEGFGAARDVLLAGQPENPPAVPVVVRIRVQDTVLSYQLPAVHRRVDPVHGEIRTPLAVAPPVFAHFDSQVALFTEDAEREISLTVGAIVPEQKVEVSLELPDGWRATPESIELQFADAEEVRQVRFSLRAPSRSSDGVMTAVMRTDAGVFSLGRQRIRYAHIPEQILFPPASIRLVRLDLKRGGERIGYLAGAGDAVAESLREAGYRVDLLDEAQVAAGALAQYDAIVMGIRAYNTIDSIAHLQPMLFRYVEEGGTLIVQYNTTGGIKTRVMGPYPLRLSRQRITDESAPVEVLAPGHPALNYPNRITPEDFDGWVQERGLYFADDWDSRYTALVAASDPGEAALAGGLLVARHGKGHFVYTGYSWFRQLPAGVPGAFRLFVNLLSLSADE